MERMLPDGQKVDAALLPPSKLPILTTPRKVGGGGGTGFNGGTAIATWTAGAFAPGAFVPCFVPCRKLPQRPCGSAAQWAVMHARACASNLCGISSGPFFYSHSPILTRATMHPAGLVCQNWTLIFLDPKDHYVGVRTTRVTV